MLTINYNKKLTTYQTNIENFLMEEHSTIVEFFIDFIIFLIEKIYKIVELVKDVVIIPALQTVTFFIMLFFLVFYLLFNLFNLDITYNVKPIFNVITELETINTDELINPHLRITTERKRKHQEKAEEIKGDFKNKTKIINQCMNVIGIQENGYITNSYCKHRYCPTCTKIKELKNKFLLEKILNNFTDKTLLFGTFTVRTIKVKNENDVKELRKKVTEAFSKLTRTFKKNIGGYIKKIETVYNPTKNECNIHIHTIFIMLNYFTDYIPKSKWLEKWKKFLNDETVTQIKLELINKTNGDLKKISSYIAKENIEKMLITDEISNIFALAEYKSRDFTFSGVFRILKKQILEEEKSEKEINKKISSILVSLKWNKEQKIYIN